VSLNGINSRFLTMSDMVVAHDDFDRSVLTSKSAQFISATKVVNLIVNLMKVPTRFMT